MTSRVYPGVTPGTRAYYRRAARVARERRERRLGRATVLRLERDRQRALRVELRCFGISPASVVRARLIRRLGLDGFYAYERQRDRERRARRKAEALVRRRVARKLAKIRRAIDSARRAGARS